MALADYKFKTNNWPPPENRRSKDSYLFGFDEDNQPYIVRWEHQRGYQGWVAATLSDHLSTEGTAVPRHYIGDSVGKILHWWADAPCLLRTVFREQTKKGKSDD